MSDLSVPVAVAPDGSVVRPSDADPTVRYRCPGCRVEVVLRRGRARRVHFAHRGGEGCSTESTLHRAAKLRIVQIVGAWRDHGGPRPCIERPCGYPGCGGGVVQDLPRSVTHARAEVRMPDGSIADVVLFRGEQPAAVIEIHVTHAVGATKAARLGVPWVELEAADVLERPYWWLTVQDGLQPFDCPTCADREAGTARALDEIRVQAIRAASRIGVALPPSPPYTYVAHSCWRCNAEMIVYSWPGGGSHSGQHPPSPVPASVRHRVTEGGGDYWANVCPRCSTVQGDYYLARDNRAYAMVMEALPLEP